MPLPGSFINESLLFIGASYEDGTAGRHQSDGRHRGTVLVLSHFDHLMKELRHELTLYMTNEIGRGRRDQVGDQRAQKVFSSPEHRHIFWGVHQEESTRQR